MLHGRSGTSILLNRLEQARRQQVSTLLLSGWDVNEQDNEGLFVGLQSYIFESNLKEIILHNCHGDLQTLVATILQSSTKSLMIRYDKQQSNIPESVVNGFLQGAAFSLDRKRLRSLSFRGMKLSLENIQALTIALRELPWLESLSFKCSFLLTEFDRSKELSLLENKPQVMKELISTIQSMPMLESLEFENCHLCDDDMARLFYVLQNGASPRIRTLKLRGNRCQAQSMESLLHWLAKPTCALSYLDLSWQLEPETAKNNSSVLEGFLFLAEGLAYNHSLHTLLLSENRIKSDYMAVLSRALSRNTTLRKLVMKDCRISLAGLALLAQNLHKYRLHTLKLNGEQRLSSRKAKDLLFRPMTRNVHLQDLALPGDTECYTSSSLNYLLERNRAGRKVLLDPKFPDHLWPTLLARADRVGRQDQRDEYRAAKHGASTIYYLLREKGPELMKREC
jgi:hypothetical protein